MAGRRKPRPRKKKKAKSKMKERQFYNVYTRKREMVPKSKISVVKFKKGIYALKAVNSRRHKMFKIFSRKKLKAMVKKFGKVKAYRR